MRACAAQSNKMAKLSAIPGLMFNCFYDADAPFVRYRVAQLFEKLILPSYVCVCFFRGVVMMCMFKSLSRLSVDVRARGLVYVYSGLSTVERKGFQALLKDKAAMQKATAKYLQVRTGSSQWLYSGGLRYGVAGSTKQCPPSKRAGLGDVGRRKPHANTQRGL